MKEEIINKVAKSGLITLDLEDYYQPGNRHFIDIKHHLFEEIILKEKDFRLFVKSHNWEKYKNQYVAVGCTADAVVPVWAYMLISNALSPFAKKVVHGNLIKLESILFEEAISNINTALYKDQRVIIKGCSNKAIPEHAYVCLTQKLSGVAKSIMYGEACSTVPIYKKK